MKQKNPNTESKRSLINAVLRGDLATAKKIREEEIGQYKGKYIIIWGERLEEDLYEILIPCWGCQRKIMTRAEVDRFIDKWGFQIYVMPSEKFPDDGVILNHPPDGFYNR